MPSNTKTKGQPGAPKTICFFNNKGGVGKTTLSCNMAAIIARKTRQRILYIDCDPQCNATQLLLEDQHWIRIFANRRKSAGQTILHPLRHIRSGDSSVDPDIPRVRAERFGFDVLPGHPTLSIVEDKLSSSWVEFKGGDNVGAARRTMWLRLLAAQLDYDIIFCDLGPSLGALNRSILLGSDYFITPMSADLFSLYALDNIFEWMQSWTKIYERATRELTESFAHELTSLEERTLGSLPVTAGYAGFTVQQYVSRTSGSEIRQVRAYDRYKKQIPQRVQALMAWASAPQMQANLGVVPNMFSMVPLAQAAHAPIVDLKPGDGLRGAQISQNLKYAKQLDKIASLLMANLGLSQTRKAHQ